MGSLVKRVVWHVVSDDADLTLRVTGQRGIMSRDWIVSHMTVQGAIDHPLASPTMSVHARTLALALEGQALTGTMILPTLIYHTQGMKGR